MSHPLRRICLIALFAIAPTMAGTSEPAVGIVHDRVDCRADPERSYALYLPAGYSSDRAWPLLLAFDPGARGRLPVERFRRAADRFGFIVAGSNDSRNFIAWEASMDAARAMWQDVAGRFSVDPQRVYTTGFSGGARVATGVALLADGVAGVIAHGGSFRSLDSLDEGISFAFVGLAGEWDMNLSEILGVDERMDSLGIAHRTFTFDGDHEWAPVETCERAMEWLEVQALRGAAVVEPPESAERLYELALARAREFERQGRLYAAFREYERIAHDFAELLDTTTARDDAARLRNRPEIPEARQVERELAVRETDERRRFVLKLKEMEQQLPDIGAYRGDLQWWRREVAGLQRDAERASTRAQEGLARRLHGFLWAVSYETAVRAYNEEDWSRAVMYYEVAIAVRPDGALLRYQLTRALARNGSIPRALDALDRAITLGFEDGERLDTDPDLARLRGHKRYEKLRSRLD